MSPSSDHPESAYRSLSLWHDTVPDDLTPRPALGEDLAVDVAVVGGGYTGLWTAYHLLRADPTIRLAVLEAQICGFGASGRNGGWCSALFPTSLGRLAKEGGRAAAIRMQQVLHDTVPAVGRVAAAEGIDCDFVQGGTLSVARNTAQWERLQAEVADYAAWGFGSADHQLLTAGEVAEHARVTDAIGGSWSPHCAVLHPAKLVRGLARAVEQLGGRIFEGTPVTELAPGRADTEHARVRATHVILATEGYTPTLPGHRRDLAPVYSLMTATEPLSEAQWDAIGLAGRPTFADNRHLVIYGQRTADGRLAFGGRGAPYHFGSAVSPDFDRHPEVHSALQRILRELFPVLAEVRFTHEWGGNLGVPRDWFPSVRHDPLTGLGFAGGYVGDGVATSALAGETLAALILGDDPRELTTLPWVGHRSRRWEPEPMRWVGVNAVTALMTAADRGEHRTGRPSRAAGAFWSFVGD